MTGYGKGSAGSSEFSAEAEVKSINSRYLEISLKIPSSLSNKEYELRELIRSKLKRGKLAISIQYKSGNLENSDLNFNKQKLKSYINFLKEVKKASKVSDKIQLEHILNNKDLFLSTETDLSEEQFQVIKEALNGSMDQLLKMKKDEGSELAKDLKKRISIIDKKVSDIEKMASEAVDEYFNKLKERVKTLLNDLPANNERLELELALIADRAEITEECVRLRSHLKFFLESINKDEEPGRKLNFLCQEMNREANTISSKSISIEITHSVVLIKEEIEKIREQIQNIE